jgi:hypothetical protein
MTAPPLPVTAAPPLRILQGGMKNTKHIHEPVASSIDNQIVRPDNRFPCSSDPAWSIEKVACGLGEIQARGMGVSVIRNRHLISPANRQ